MNPLLENFLPLKLLSLQISAWAQLRQHKLQRMIAFQSLCKKINTAIKMEHKSDIVQTYDWVMFTDWLFLTVYFRS